MHNKKLWIKARRTTGIAKFERRCPCSVYTCIDGRRRKVKDYRIPGTQAHGHHTMLQRYTMFAYDRLLAQGDNQ